MRYVIPIFVAFLCLPALVQAQVRLTGRVLDDATGQPLAGASVYINHTTIGTTTQADGSYSIGGLEAGTYELVVSYVGYERILYDINVQSKDLRYVFRMEAKVAQMRDILVLGPQLRKQWLDIFRTQFLGTSAAAEATTILNEEDIFFSNSGDENVISAFTDVPLVIENKALGYRVFFELLAFEYNRRTDKCTFFGYNHYEELDGPDSKPNRFSVSRAEAYKGSTMHFFRSLKSNRLREEGFTIRRVLPAPEKKRAAKGEDSTGGIINPDTFVPGESYPADRKSMLFRDSTQQLDYLLWNGALQVTYLSPSEANIGLTQPADITGDTRGVISYVFINRTPVYILEDGMPLDPRSLRYGGHWNQERLANMLPQDFKPSGKSILNKKRL